VEVELVFFFDGSAVGDSRAEMIYAAGGAESSRLNIGLIPGSHGISNS